MAVNFAEMPVDYGLKYAFDCGTYESGNVWSGYNDINMTLKNASKAADGAVYFTTTGFGYWVNSDSYNDCTKYAIVKANSSSSGNLWVFTERGASSSYSTDIDINGNYITLYTNGGGTSKTAVLSTDYHVIATVKSGTTATLYIDGVQVAQLTGKATFKPTNYGLNTASGTGSVPSSGDTTAYVRCAVVCSTGHSAFEVKQNSEWLLVQYGLMAEPLNSEMSGADAAAIAWCIARNMEQSKSLEMQKKSYKNGLKQGIEGGADIKEDYEQDNTHLDMTMNSNGGISEPFIGNLTDGIYYTDSDGSYVYMYLDMSYSETLSDGTIRTGRMVYEAYDSSGALVDTATSIGTGSWGWYSIHGSMVRDVTNMSINESKVTCIHRDTYDDGRVYYYNMDWSPSGFSGSSIMLNAVKVGNIPPEIIS